MRLGNARLGEAGLGNAHPNNVKWLEHRQVDPIRSNATVPVTMGTRKSSAKCEKPRDLAIAGLL